MKRCGVPLVTTCPNVALSDDPGATCSDHTRGVFVIRYAESTMTLWDFRPDLEFPQWYGPDVSTDRKGTRYEFATADEARAWMQQQEGERGRTFYRAVVARALPPVAEQFINVDPTPPEDSP